MAIQIGKYKRPGIFVEEFDNSIISSPLVEGITNMVIGVSKKGPVNTPIRLTTISELESIFGQLDRGLERKGSYFHRTISKMLETSPIFAINLLLTDDTLDVIEYKSLSSSSGKKNDVKREGPYRRFFDTTGFWKRDTESFLNLTKNNAGYSDRALSITNLSDKTVSVFIIKSPVLGFDRTLVEWYGSLDKMPPYLNQSDFASDYIVDVVVVGGDWSNYQELAVDNRWSNYFNASGLKKEQLRNFANDRNVSLLAFYEGVSLIPYFRDGNGKNIFIETSINRDTDRTGLFCSFNADLVEKDYYTGMLDLLGNTIVDADETDIEFLSYKETISESVSFNVVPLDLPGNVTAVIGDPYLGYSDMEAHAFQIDTLTDYPKTSGNLEHADNRTAWFAEGFVYGVKKDSFISVTSSIYVEYSVETGSYCVIGDNYISVATGSVSFDIIPTDYPVLSTSKTYYTAFVLDASGEISEVKTVTSGVRPSVSTSDIVLGYVSFDLQNGEIISSDYTPVSVNDTGFNDFTFGTNSSVHDIYVSTAGVGSIKVEFIGTNDKAVSSNYEQYRRIKQFNRLINLIDSPNKYKMAMNLGISQGYRKVSLSGVTITNIVTSTTQNKSFVLNTGLSNTELATVLQGYLVFYSEDNEMLIGELGMDTKEGVAGATYGVVGKYSKFYSRYYDGIINTKDFFYDNRLYVDSAGNDNSLVGQGVNVIFIDGEATSAGATSSYAGYDYVIFETSVSDFDDQVGLETFDQIVFPDSSTNKGSFTIVTNVVEPMDTPSELAQNLGFVDTVDSKYFAYQVNEEVQYEYLTDVKLIYDYLTKHYLKMYLENNGDLSVRFMDNLLESDEPASVMANSMFYVQSEKSNLKQTIEIELPTGYTRVPNKILINGSRYTEVKVGDFLEAYVDVANLQAGETPRKLTRILSKRQYPGDTSLTEISCDARINTYSFGGDLQTTRFVSVDQYALTYKAITLKGFRIRQSSLPDGTEAKQNQILNLVAKGTPLFKAITNKESIDFRYLIDAFGLGLVEKSKQQLVDICGDRLDVFGFINMPSMRQFKNSTSPSFVNKEGVLQLEYVAKGGDPESNPAFIYSFGDGPGSTCVGYFMPYVIGNDNGRPVELPPAMHIATTYMRKHISNITSITPWTIAAGVTNGRVINIPGTEIDFTLSDIEYINQAQMNPIVFKRNRGFSIETENTAQTLYKSALSYIHVREVLIELERELSRMLLDFQWKFNTPDVRSEIKLRADVICETYVSKNGLYNYFNKMDEENNTNEIIDNQFGVLDTYVEPIKGMGIIVNNITILRTGAISAGGFINP